MEDLSHDTYLGDIVSADGRNTLNVDVKKIVGKGLDIITKIVNLMEFVCLGELYFETLILLRESIFINQKDAKPHLFSLICCNLDLE